MEGYRLIYLTVGDKSAAEAIARRLVEQRLAACVHVMPPGQSVYWWEDALQWREEQVLLVKTSAALADAVIAAVAGWHEDECPCVVSLAVAEGHPPFLAWIRAQLREA
jgi:periplasmic divalent cation tolerance protein